MPAPRFSVITPVYDTPAPVLQRMLASVQAQSFGDWEHCLVDDGSSAPDVGEILDRAAGDDPRIRVRRRDVNGGIVAASNDALKMASGEFVALLDHDDELAVDALALADGALRAKPEADYLYTDEDKVGPDGAHFDAFYKPDWSPERLRTQMYTCHLSVLRRSLVEEVGGFDPEFEGSQDWDLVLKVTERARDVAHVPQILYHWRALEASAAGGGEAAKPEAFEAGRRAVQAHCDRTGFEATVERDPDDPGIYHLRPKLKQRPKVSIVIPTRGQAGEVGYEPVTHVVHCVRGIVSKSAYDDYEIVCVADESTPRPVLEELKEIAGERMRLVHFGREFSFSAKINLGAIRSRGEHLLLLNDDTDVIAPDWIERMVMYSSRPEIGAVGARLLYPDQRLQHVGILFDEGRPNHIYTGYAGDFRGYFNNVLLACNYLAVTGACMMTRRDLFEELGGLTTTLPVNFNDVDYCFKVWSSGRRVVYDPDTVMHHFESASRPAVVEEWEINGLIQRWGAVSNIDPFSNPNFRGRAPDRYPASARELLRSSTARLRSGLRRRLTPVG